MSPRTEVALPLTATAEEIAGAITQAQARARVRLIDDPAAVAREVRHAIDQVEAMAAAAGLPHAGWLDPRGVWWTSGRYQDGAVRTMVELQGHRIVARRGGAYTTIAPGRLQLNLRTDGRAPHGLSLGGL